MLQFVFTKILVPAHKVFVKRRVVMYETHLSGVIMHLINSRHHLQQQSLIDYFSMDFCTASLTLMEPATLSLNA